MTADGHKADFPTQSDISAFLRSLSDKPDGLVRAGIPYNTAKNWYRPEPSDMSAANLLRVVIALDAEKAFVEWLRRLRVALAAPLEPMPEFQPKREGAAARKGGRKRRAS